MFKFIKRIMGISGEYRKKLNIAYVLSFFESLFSNVPVFMVLYILMEILNNTFSVKTIVISSIGIVVGVVVRMILRYLVDVNLSLIHI